MLTEFPVIHTNIWDAIWAIPVIVVVIILIKAFFKASFELVIDRCGCHWTDYFHLH